MNVKPYISVIVPCYNQSEFLGEALESVLSQTFTNWECIIVNDGSSDQTEELAKKYCETDDRFKYLKKQNGGLSSARNAGIDKSSGVYILPLDADDYIGPKYLQFAVNVFNNAPEISVVYSNAMLFGGMDKAWDLRPYTYLELLKSNMIFCSSVFKKEDFEAVGRYDEQLKTGYEDWDFYIRLLNPESKVVKSDDFHFYYRIKEKSMYKAIDDKMHLDLSHLIYRKYQDKYKMYFGNPIEMIGKIEFYEVMYKNSTDYKLGNFFLTPLRRILKGFKSVIK